MVGGEPTAAVKSPHIQRPKVSCATTLRTPAIRSWRRSINADIVVNMNIENSLSGYVCPARARCARIQMNVSAICHNALPPNITPSSSPGTRSTSTLYDCWRSIKFPFFLPTNGTITCTLPLWAPSRPPTSKSKNPPLVRDGPLKWPHQRVGVRNPNSKGHTKAWENFAQCARHVPGALTYSLCPQDSRQFRRHGRTCPSMAYRPPPQDIIQWLVAPP